MWFGSTALDNRLRHLANRSRLFRASGGIWRQAFVFLQGRLIDATMRRFRRRLRYERLLDIEKMASGSLKRGPYATPGQRTVRGISVPDSREKKLEHLQKIAALPDLPQQT